MTYEIYENIGNITLRSTPSTCGVVGHSFGQHGLSAAWGSIHEHTPWGVDAYLLVEVKVGEWQLHCFSHFLLLDVHTSNVGVRHIRLLI